MWRSLEGCKIREQSLGSVTEYVLSQGWSRQEQQQQRHGKLEWDNAHLAWDKWESPSKRFGVVPCRNERIMEATGEALKTWWGSNSKFWKERCLTHVAGLIQFAWLCFCTSLFWCVLLTLMCWKQTWWVTCTYFHFQSKHLPRICQKSITSLKQLEQSGSKSWKVALSLPCFFPPFICISLLFFVPTGYCSEVAIPAHSTFHTLEYLCGNSARP